MRTPDRKALGKAHFTGENDLSASIWELDSLAAELGRAAVRWCAEGGSTDDHLTSNPDSPIKNYSLGESVIHFSVRRNPMDVYSGYPMADDLKLAACAPASWP